MLSSKVTCNSHGQDSSYFLGWEEYEKNPYDEVKNPDGIIQMGLAENQLSFDLLESWLENNPQPAAFKKHNNQSVFKELALFQDYHGLPAFKNALVKFMSEIRGNTVGFNPNNLVLTAGATSANETLMFCLANPGDAFLLPTPYYPGFDRDLKWRTGAEIVPIHCSSFNGFRITKSALEEAYKQAEKQNLKVKGVLVTNPSNPLGTSLSLHELDLLVNFISSKNIHLISDEIYSGTVFSSPSFISIMEVLQNRNLMNTELSKQVHIVYSLSKDLGLPGFRIGAIYSNNELVVESATKMSSFGLVSSQTQYLLSEILSDNKFTKAYLSENRRRLKERHEMLVEGLQRSGIRCLSAKKRKIDSATIPSATRIVTVKTTLNDDVVIFRFPISSGLLNLKDIVAQRFKLKSKRLRLKYIDKENDLILIACDEDLKFAVDTTAINNSINLICISDGFCAGCVHNVEVIQPTLESVADNFTSDSESLVATGVVDAGKKSHQGKKRKRESDTLPPVTGLVTAKITYNKCMKVFQFFISSGITNLENEVAQSFKLKGKKLRLKYWDEDDDLILIACDVDLKLAVVTTSINNTINLICLSD